MWKLDFRKKTCCRIMSIYRILFGVFSCFIVMTTYLILFGSPMETLLICCSIAFVLNNSIFSLIAKFVLYCISKQTLKIDFDHISLSQLCLKGLNIQTRFTSINIGLVQLNLRITQCIRSYGSTLPVILILDNVDAKFCDIGAKMEPPISEKSGSQNPKNNLAVLNNKKENMLSNFTWLLTHIEIQSSKISVQLQEDFHDTTINLSQMHFKLKQIDPSVKKERKSIQKDHEIQFELKYLDISTTFQAECQKTPLSYSLLYVSRYWLSISLNLNKPLNNMITSMVMYSDDEIRIGVYPEILSRFMKLATSSHVVRPPPTVGSHTENQLQISFPSIPEKLELKFPSIQLKLFYNTLHSIDRNSEYLDCSTSLSFTHIHGIDPKDPSIYISKMECCLNMGNIDGLLSYSDVTVRNVCAFRKNHGQSNIIYVSDLQSNRTSLSLNSLQFDISPETISLVKFIRDIQLLRPINNRNNHNNKFRKSGFPSVRVQKEIAPDLSLSMKVAANNCSLSVTVPVSQGKKEAADRCIGGAETTKLTIRILSASMKLKSRCSIRNYKPYILFQLPCACSVNVDKVFSSLYPATGGEDSNADNTLPANDDDSCDRFDVISYSPGKLLRMDDILIRMVFNKYNNNNNNKSASIDKDSVCKGEYKSDVRVKRLSPVIDGAIHHAYLTIDTLILDQILNIVTWSSASLLKTDLDGHIYKVSNYTPAARSNTHTPSTFLSSDRTSASTTGPKPIDGVSITKRSAIAFDGQVDLSSSQMKVKLNHIGGIVRVVNECPPVYIGFDSFTLKYHKAVSVETLSLSKLFMKYLYKDFISVDSLYLKSVLVDKNILEIKDLALCVRRDGTGAMFDVSVVDPALSWTGGTMWGVILSCDRVQDYISKLHQPSISHSYSNETSRKSRSETKRNLIKVNISNVQATARFSDTAVVLLVMEQVMISNYRAPVNTLDSDSDLDLNEKYCRVDLKKIGLHLEGQSVPLLQLPSRSTVTMRYSSGLRLCISFISDYLLVELNEHQRMNFVLLQWLATYKALKTLWKSRSIYVAKPLSDSDVTFETSGRIGKVRVSVGDDHSNPRYEENVSLMDVKVRDLNAVFIKDKVRHKRSNLLLKLIKLDGCKNPPLKHGFSDVLGGFVRLDVKEIQCLFRSIPFPFMDASAVTIEGDIVLADLNICPRSERREWFEVYTSTDMRHKLHSYLVQSNRSYRSSHAEEQPHQGMSCFKVNLVKSTTPVKLYHDLDVRSRTLNVTYGKYWDFPLFAVTRVIDVILPKSSDLSPKLPVWDNFRYMFHGRFSLVTSSFMMRLAAADTHQKDALVFTTDAFKLSYEYGSFVLNIVKLVIQAVIPSGALAFSSTVDGARLRGDAGVELDHLEHLNSDNQYHEMLVMTSENVDISADLNWIANRPDDHYVQLHLPKDGPLDTYKDFRSTGVEMNLRFNLVSKDSYDAGKGSQIYMCWPIVDYMWAIYDMFIRESPAATSESRLSRVEFSRWIDQLVVTVDVQEMGVLWWENIDAVDAISVQIENVLLSYLGHNEVISEKSFSICDAIRNSYANVGLFLVTTELSEEHILGGGVISVQWPEPPDETFFAGASEINYSEGKLNSLDEVVCDSTDNSPVKIKKKETTTSQSKAFVKKHSLRRIDTHDLNFKQPATVVVGDLKILYSVRIRDIATDFFASINSWMYSSSGGTSNAEGEVGISPSTTTNLSNIDILSPLSEPSLFNNSNNSKLKFDEETPRLKLQKQFLSRRRSSRSLRTRSDSSSSELSWILSPKDPSPRTSSIEVDDNPMLSMLLKRNTALKGGEREGDDGFLGRDGDGGSPERERTFSSETNANLFKGGTKYFRNYSDVTKTIIKYDILINKAQVNFHSPQTRSTLLLQIHQSQVLCKSYRMKQRLIAGDERVEFDFVFQGVNAYISEEDSRSGSLVHWIDASERVGGAMNPFVNVIMQDFDLQVLWVYYEESVVSNRVDASKKNKNIIKEHDPVLQHSSSSFNDVEMGGVCVDLNNCILKLNPTQFFQLLNVVKNVILAPPRKPGEDCEKSESAVDITNTTATTATTGVADGNKSSIQSILVESGEFPGLFTNTKLKASDKLRIEYELGEALKLVDTRRTDPAYRLQVNSNSVKWTFCDNSDHPFAEANVYKLSGSRVQNRDGSTIDELEIEEMEVFDLTSPVHTEDSNEHTSKLIFGSTHNPSSMIQNVDAYNQDNMFLFRSETIPRISLQHLGIPAVKIMDHFEVTVYPSDMKILYLDLSYDTFSQINEYFFGEDIVNDDSLTPSSPDVASNAKNPLLYPSLSSPNAASSSTFNALAGSLSPKKLFSRKYGKINSNSISDITTSVSKGVSKDITSTSVNHPRIKTLQRPTSLSLASKSRKLRRKTHHRRIVSADLMLSERLLIGSEGAFSEGISVSSSTYLHHNREFKPIFSRHRRSSSEDLSSSTHRAPADSFDIVNHIDNSTTFENVMDEPLKPVIKLVHGVSDVNSTADNDIPNIQDSGFVLDSKYERPARRRSRSHSITMQHNDQSLYELLRLGEEGRDTVPLHSHSLAHTTANTSRRSSHTRHFSYENHNNNTSALAISSGSALLGLGSTSCIHTFELNGNVKYCDVCHLAVSYIRNPGYRCTACGLGSHPFCREKSYPKEHQKSLQSARSKEIMMEYLLFRYVRLNNITVIASLHGFPLVKAITNFSADLKPMVISNKLLTWTRLIEKIESKYTMDGYKLAPSLFKNLIVGNSSYTASHTVKGSKVNDNNNNNNNNNGNNKNSKYSRKSYNKRSDNASAKHSFAPSEADVIAITGNFSNSSKKFGLKKLASTFRGAKPAPSTHNYTSDNNTHNYNSYGDDNINTSNLDAKRMHLKKSLTFRLLDEDETSARVNYSNKLVDADKKKKKKFLGGIFHGLTGGTKSKRGGYSK